MPELEMLYFVTEAEDNQAHMICVGKYFKIWVCCECATVLDS